MASNCSSWPGRASWAISVQAAASKVKSSYFSAAFLPGVVQKWRRRHVRSRLLRGFGGIGDADSSWAVGQCNQLMINDDFFDLLQTLLVKRQDGIAYDLFLLQLADDITI